MTTPYGKHWADTLTLRDEVRHTDGSGGDLQMSLAKAIYQMVPVPYASCDYYAEITEPTPLLVGFLARVARRLGVPGLETQACFHLDQGMGGGKSHALVGIWHMVNDPALFFRSDLGQAVATEASADGLRVDLDGVISVALLGDSMSPGKTDPRFGPATDMFGRFLWMVLDGESDRLARWQHYLSLGPNKATLQTVFADLNKPVLIIIDELMDYAMALTDQASIGGMPGEQAFLNALTDAVDDQPGVVLVVVMIRSDEDPVGYHPAAVELRDYLGARLQRNGETVTVTEPADFAQIIRRRLFVRADAEPAAAAVADAFLAADDVWQSQVYGQLGPGRNLGQFHDQVLRMYPFHPHVFQLVAQEWSIVQAFQRVRSTVAIFARTVLHWTTEHEAGRWAPDLIGPGDIPLHTNALEAMLSSGVLAGNDRAIQGFRAVANTDIISSGGSTGTALAIDTTLQSAGVQTDQPSPAVRMATACFAYSLVPRPQSTRGATKAELIAAIGGPGIAYLPAEEVFNALVASPAQGGLGALERTRGSGKTPERYYLSIKQTLNMYHSNAMSMVNDDAALERVWKRAQHLSVRGGFTVQHLDMPAGPVPAAECFANTDGQENLLLVLDPRRWTLHNGRDAATRHDLDVAFGVAPGLTMNYAASMVVALVNTQRCGRARDRARDAIAWEMVVNQLDPSDEEYSGAKGLRDEAAEKLDDEVKRAYQNYAYLLRTNAGLSVQYKTVPEKATSLSGVAVWAGLVEEGRAVATGRLAPEYLGQLITTGSFQRDLTPKELFSLPYSDPSWPLVATVDDLRQALYAMVIGASWMLVDSDGNEIRPAEAGQIQTASMQQVLQPRQQSERPPTTAPIGSESSDDAAVRGQDSQSRPGSAKQPSRSVHPTEPVTYEITKIRMPVSSMTNDDRRNEVWSAIRELASLVDLARADVRDLQMLGLEITVTARQGDSAQLVVKAKGLPGVSVYVEDDEFAL